MGHLELGRQTVTEDSSPGRVTFPWEAQGIGENVHRYQTPLALA